MGKGLVNACFALSCPLILILYICLFVQHEVEACVFLLTRCRLHSDDKSCFRGEGGRW